jgi:hypothetical protein
VSGPAGIHRIRDLEPVPFALPFEKLPRAAPAAHYCGSRPSARRPRLHVARSIRMTRLALTVLLLALAVAPARAQSYASRAKAETGSYAGTVEYVEGAWAITVCGTRPVTWFSGEMPDSARGIVEVHEAEHRRFMASFPSCERFNAWKRASVDNAIVAEARAFCAGAKYDYLRGRYPSLMEAVWAQSKTFGQYFLTLGPEDAAGAIYKNCG